MVGGRRATPDPASPSVLAAESRLLPAGQGGGAGPRSQVQARQPGAGEEPLIQITH